MAGTRNIFFLHIPKTAGTSLKHFLFHRFPAHACLMDPANPGSGDFDRYALVAGHLDHDFVRRYRRRPLVLTCLRRPVDRALSAYYYQRTARLAVEIQQSAALIGAAAAEKVLDGLRRLNRCDSLLDFLRREPEWARESLGNVQTRFLAGAAAVAAYEQQPERLLAVAMDNLRACEGILLAEHLPESLALIGEPLGWQEQEALPRDNSTSGRRPAADHDAESLAALAELTALDGELYRLAEQLFEERRQTAARSPAAAVPEASLSSAADFTFDQPIRGSGWHIRERGADGWYCWTDQEASLHLRLSGTGDHNLHLQVEHAACVEAWLGLSVSINGCPVELTARQGAPPGPVAARVPAHLLSNSPGRVLLTLRVPRTVRPLDGDPGNPDSRRLGVALSRVQLTPCPVTSKEGTALSVKGIIRLDNWWCAKIPPLLAAAYVLVLIGGIGLGRAVVLLACFVFSVACVAAYGHVVNDLFDIEVDRQAGKPNAIAGFRPALAFLIAAGFVLAGFLPAPLAGYSSPARVVLLLNYLWPTVYSVPGIRLKERGLGGVVCDAAGSHITPTLFAVTVFAPVGPGRSIPWVVAVLLVAWSAVQGIKGILNHQVADRENDEVAGVATFATTARRLEWFLPRFNLLAELPVSCLLASILAVRCPAALVAFAAYCSVELAKYKLGFEFALTARHRRASFPFVNELFYVVWFPLAAAVQLALLGPGWLWLPILHGLIFLPVLRLQARDLRSVAVALGWRFPRFPGLHRGRAHGGLSSEDFFPEATSAGRPCQPGKAGS
jgi:4-hydroxybenzoate polyprenyltransferase